MNESQSKSGEKAQPQLKGYLWAIGVTLIATAVGWPLYHGFHLPDEARHPLLADTNVLMLYLVGVLWVATHYDRRAAILASVLGVLAFDLCFVKPYFRLTVIEEQYLITFAVMLLTALVISTLTHRVRTQSQAAREAWERAEAEFLRNTLLSSVSHDLRTPISAVIGAAGLLEVADEKRLPPSARAELLAVICAESERMERLVNNLLDMTRLESGGLVLRREWQHLPEVIGSALRHLEKRLKHRAVQTRIAPDLPLVSMDAVAIEQALVNLIDNAVQYAPPDAPIEVEARATASDVIVEIADHGPGLPAGAEQRVFEKFFRVPGVAAGRSEPGRKGLGLGLAICKGIVESHGGRITAANRPGGGGAVFTIVLPRSANEPQVDGTA
jgi:K+-sensing histidine kinase KdpD